MTQTLRKVLWIGACLVLPSLMKSCLSRMGSEIDPLCLVGSSNPGVISPDGCTTGGLAAVAEVLKSEVEIG